MRMLALAGWLGLSSALECYSVECLNSQSDQIISAFTSRLVRGEEACPCCFLTNSSSSTQATSTTTTTTTTSTAVPEADTGVQTAHPEAAPLVTSLEVRIAEQRLVECRTQLGDKQVQLANRRDELVLLKAELASSQRDLAASLQANDALQGDLLAARAGERDARQQMTQKDLRNDVLHSRLQSYVASFTSLQIKLGALTDHVSRCSCSGENENP